MTTSTMTISTRDLKVGFSHGHAEKVLFENLHLSLYTGQLVCFMGPNGVGKSSLIRTLAGLQRPLGGNIELQNPGEDPARLISVVLTERIISHNLTVRDLVTFGRYPYVSWNAALTRDDKTKISQAISMLGLDNLSSTLIHELSDGQLQMALIARAIAQDTPVILLDEPTAHLDLNNRVEIMKLLRRLTRELNKSILVSTHELDLALQTADLTWLAGQDRTIKTGIPEDLVLNGSFDEIFRFKGFDLKTGRIIHPANPGARVISVSGNGPAYLWTRNALERHGFSVSVGEGDAGINVDVFVKETEQKWAVKVNNRQYEVMTIAELIELIHSNVCNIPE